jgi:hypothetical protein
MMWGTSIVAAVGAAALSLVGQYILSSYQAQQTQRTAAVTKFIEVSQQFDRSVTEFMTPYLAGKTSDAQREALRKNIQEQFLALEQTEGILPAGKEARASAYKEALVDVDGRLGETVAAPKARKLVQAIANARDANVCVAYFMKAEVGLSVSADDASYCADGARHQLKPL